MFHDTVDRGVIFRLSPTAKSLWILLLRMQDQDRFCWPGVVYIAKKIGAHRASVFRALAELERTNLIRRESGGGRTHTSYQLVD